VFAPLGLAPAQLGKVLARSLCCFLDDHKYRSSSLCSSILLLRFPTFLLPILGSSLGLIHAPLDPSHPGVPRLSGCSASPQQGLQYFQPPPVTKLLSHQAIDVAALRLYKRRQCRCWYNSCWILVIPSLATMGPFSALAFLVSQKYKFSVAASLKCHP
jgi:hypothetical protein